MLRIDYLVALCLMRRVCQQIQARHREMLDPEQSEFGRDFASAMQGNLACKLASRVRALMETDYSSLNAEFHDRLEFIGHLADTILDADTRSAGQSVEAIMARATVDGLGIQLADEIMLWTDSVHNEQREAPF